MYSDWDCTVLTKAITNEMWICNQREDGGGGGGAINAADAKALARRRAVEGSTVVDAVDSC